MIFPTFSDLKYKQSTVIIMVCESLISQMTVITIVWEVPSSNMTIISIVLESLSSKIAIIIVVRGHWDHLGDHFGTLRKTVG